MNTKERLLNNQFIKNYKLMWPFVKPIWFRALISVLICIPIGSLDAVIALSLKPYTDLVVVGKDMSSPWYIPLLIVAFTSIQGLLNYLAGYLNVWVGGKMTIALKDRLYEKLVNFDADFFDKSTSGEIMFRFNNDADNACSGLLGNLKTFVTRIFSSISLAAVLFYNSWQLAIVAMIVLGAAIAPLSRVKSLVGSIINQNNVSVTALNTTYNETFAGNKTISAYNLQGSRSNKFRNILNSVFSFSIKMCQRTGWISPFMHFAVSIGIGLAIALGSWLIVEGVISSGNFVSFITALILLYTPIKNLGGNAVAVQQSFLAIERVFEMIDRPLPIQDKENALELKYISKGIEFKNVNFEYAPGVPVLRDINISVKAGETLALVGGSGGGKTTFVNLIPRFYDIKSGSIMIDGADIRDYTLQSLRANIAVVFQDNFLFSGTIRENILLGSPDADDAQIGKALEMAYLTDFVNKLQDGINTQIGERGILLSGGQKQRVAIARAFLKNAPIVILDEATSALDNKSEKIVQKAINNLMKDKTVFVIAHRLSTIQNAGRIAVINGGELVELGTHRELISIPDGQYKHLYEMQFKRGDILLMRPAGQEAAV
ncbi:MAG: ATP-binding cassette domain-containing protein [Heliobacteriaceae bacterium]|jgi:subfamily B ATP-binding cassette protein MsbA|nr:ATP-binding cassette domain-containing protein [Heliobacteriaceae bacterium]